ncbi:hypothetical protein GWC95_09930 [Sediminibacterium roseum]|uniref:Lipocalin-like domain-containing protein n=1 Tax=Sediminibacterium roseum TaxID=1978412 RepID=A0ABW9ZV47_9BACT|nr:hypothetical protein [Sediminibacterium roseum]NCI50242.1 hypothetical protein [Sediminibacterium roseum]
MKSKTIAAITIAAAVLIFAFVLFSKKQAQKPFSLVGEWRVDSTYLSDTSKPASSFFVAVKNKPEDKGSVFFNADSTVSDSPHSTDSIQTKYYLKDSTLFINAGTGKGFVPNKVVQMNDSSFAFLVEDAVTVVLRRK